MLVEPKSVTTSFNYLIGGGLVFDNLMFLSNFWFDGGLFIWLPGPPLLPGPRGLLLFIAISLVDVTGAQSGLDHYLSHSVCFHHAYK
jgi:hypothetical protein